LVQIIHENLAALSKVIRGISLITNEIQEYAKDLLQNGVINKKNIPFLTRWPSSVLNNMLLCFHVLESQ
jgi:predicted transcriptional regulator